MPDFKRSKIFISTYKLCVTFKYTNFPVAMYVDSIHIAYLTIIFCCRNICVCSVTIFAKF